MVQVVCSNVEKHSVKMMAELNRMKQEKDHCDFIIQVGNDVYHAHKNVLSAGSDYFKAILKHGTKESREGKVVFKDVDFECVKNCVDFIYSGKLEITDEKMNDLLHVAIMMQLEDLVEAFRRLVKTKEEICNDELIILSDDGRCTGDVELKTAANAWKPIKRDTNSTLSQEELDTLGIMRCVSVILNKITRSTFKDFMKQVLALKIDTEKKLRGTVDLIFEKAINKPIFSEVYANMCRQMTQIRVTAEESSDQQNATGPVEFRKLILTKCQKEFERDKSVLQHLLELKKKMEANTDQELAPQLKVEYDTAKFKDRRRTLGNIRFIGELFKVRMLTEPIMHNCIMTLFKAKDDDHLESLCRLLTTIGKDLDHPKAKERMDQYFSHIQKIIDEKRTSSRVRLLLQYVNNLRTNNWVPHAIQTQGPKTFGQIRRDAKNEQEMLQQKLASPPNPIQKQGSRKKNRMGNRVGHEDGWTKVQTVKPVLFDRSKMKMQCTTLVNVRHDNIRELGAQPRGQSMSALKARQNEPSKRYRLEMDLTQLLNKGLTNSDIFDWVVKNLTTKESVGPDFIRALTISVCRRSLKIDPKNSDKMTVVEDKITERSILLNKYIENRQDRELQVLYALQNLMVELGQPRDVLSMLFDVFYNEDVVQEQTFYNWEKSEDPNEQEGRRVAVASVNMFFTWLRTADPDSDGD